MCDEQSESQVNSKPPDPESLSFIQSDLELRTPSQRDRMARVIFFDIIGLKRVAMDKVTPWRI